jgi:c-di-GMP-binding flagellar brake protein YcgR
MPTVDRRQHVRQPLALSVRFEHLPSRREFKARCVDISRGGLLLYVPATVPVQVGHPIRLALKGMKKPEFEDLSDKTFEAHVVHVDRHTLIPMGHLAIGVRFASTYVAECK